jgi:NAD(P)H-quinone oxidoreductase subunit 4
MLTQVYDTTTLQVTARVRDSVPTLAQGQQAATVSFRAPEIGAR